jgi:hypothetical protein
MQPSLYVKYSYILFTSFSFPFCTFLFILSRLSGPDLLGNIIDKLELGKHLLLSHTLSTDSDTSETALRADTNCLESLLKAATLTISDDLGSVENSVLDDLGILELGLLGGDDTEDDVLVLGEETEGLETAGAGVVVLEEEGVVVEGLEELFGDLFVGALAKVHRLGEVAWRVLVIEV